jgi:DNA polymerase bacteriophage-type
MSVIHLHLDFETRSLLDIKRVGLDRYARNAAALMLAWAVNDQPPQLWLPEKDPRWIPAELLVLLQNPAVVKLAQNSAFERAIFLHALGIDIPVEQWFDPSVLARYAGLPGKLALVSQFLKLGDKGKDKEGSRLINKFSKPYGKDKKFRDPSDPKHAADWEKFKDYCKQDVVAEREVFHRLSSFFMPPDSERKLWVLDAKINERGMPVRMDYVAECQKAVDDVTHVSLGVMRVATGLENPNSGQQLLPWLKDRGYPFSSLTKDRVAKALAGKLDDRVRDVLELKQTISRSSVKKLQAITDRVVEGRLRYQYKFYGAHTGRWAGEGAQLQNLPRKASKWGDTDVDIRACFGAPAGKKLVVADLASIETRVLAWLSKCDTLLNVFKLGQDPYIDFASDLYSTPYSDVTKEQRQISKPAVLGCGYMLSGGEWRMDCCGKFQFKLEWVKPVDVCSCKIKGDAFKSGLWGYAENMGVAMEQQQAKDAVSAYRAKYSEVVDLWYSLENTIVEVLSFGGTVFDRVSSIPFWCVPGKVLIARLPSGRRLHWLNPKVVPGRGLRSKVTHYAHTIKGWRTESLYGGLLTENLVQAISRDVLAEGMLRADKTGFEIVGHTHDEIIALDSCNNAEGRMLGELIHNMTLPMPWAPDLPLAAEGYEAEIYKK